MGYEPKEIIERNKPMLIEEDLVLRLRNKSLYAKPDIIYRNDKELILTDYKVFKSKPSKHKLQELIDVVLLYVFENINADKYNNADEFKKKTQVLEDDFQDLKELMDRIDNLKSK